MSRRLTSPALRDPEQRDPPSGLAGQPLAERNPNHLVHQILHPAEAGFRMTFCFFMWKASSGGHRTCCRSQISTILPSPYRRGLGSVLSEVRLDAVETNEVEGVRSHKGKCRLRQTIMHDPIVALERLPASLYHRRQAGNPEKRGRLTFPCEGKG